MHYHTVNKWLKEVRVMQRQLKDLIELGQRELPRVAAQASVCGHELENLVVLLRDSDYGVKKDS